MRLAFLWERMRQSLWFIPTMLTILAGVAALLSIQLDRSVSDDDLFRDAWFLTDVGADGARAVLSVIAQSVITVTGVVFSVTIVALQLAATQFTPRVLRAFLSDRGSQWVLGIFIATFTFTLIVERTVRAPVGAAGAMVPSISVTIAILLSLISIGALIFFINHIAQSIRASVILARLTADAIAVIDDLFPSTIADPAEDQPPDHSPTVPVGTPWLVPAHASGYLQSVDEDALLSIAEEGPAVIRMELAMGHFIYPGEPLASVWLDEPSPVGGMEEVERKVRAAFIVANQWTLGQDLERALVELTDIAIRALSPALNDPTTASQVVDRVGELLIRVGRRHEPDPSRTDAAGKVRFIARTLPWERAVEVGFAHIRNYASGSPNVMIRMVEVCGRIRAQVSPRRWPPLEWEMHQIVEAARVTGLLESDFERITRAVEAAMRVPPSVDPAAGVTQGNRRTEHLHQHD